MSLKVLIVSSHGMKCGIASYAEVLRSLLDQDFKVSIAALDQSLLRRQERHVIRAGDRHIRSICKSLKEYDVVNLQWEPGLLGYTHGDIIRRFRWLLGAAPKLILTAHTVLHYPKSGLLHWAHTARSQGLRGLLLSRWDTDLARHSYAAIRSRARQGNFALVAHTERDRRFLRDVVGIESTVAHPLSHIRADWPARLARDTPPARKELQSLFPSKRTFVGVFGILSEYKGILAALKALPYFEEDWQLVIYGGVHPTTIRHREAIDPYVSELIKELESKSKAHRIRLGPSGKARTRNPLVDRVAFLGAPDDYEFAVAINAVDVCVFPYLKVGQSASGPVSHAIELGKPTIVTRTSTFIELERYFPKHFEMIDIGNHIQLAQTVKRLVAIPRRKPPLYYSKETLAELYGDLIRRCAGKEMLVSKHERYRDRHESKSGIPAPAE